MSDKPLILIVEDDRPIRNFISVSLTAQDYRTLETDNGRDALEYAATRNPEIILLDLGLPDMDGLEVIRSIRSWSLIPIIVVSARGQEREKVEALDYGADDYLTKPFSIAELQARVRVALRHRIRTDVSERRSEEFAVGDLRINFDKRIITLETQEVHLTPIEYRLVELMSKHAGKVLTHNYILKEIWGPNSGSEMQSLRVFMANIRRKIESDPTQPRYILTEVGVGYRMVEE